MRSSVLLTTPIAKAKGALSPIALSRLATVHHPQPDATSDKLTRTTHSDSGITRGFQAKALLSLVPFRPGMIRTVQITLGFNTPCTVMPTLR